MFLSRDLSASRSATDDFWYAPVFRGAGGPVTATAAMQLSTVYKCVRVIAETLGMLPCHVYRRLPEGGKQRQPDHPVARLLERPNPWQTAMQWREMMQAHATLRGVGYSRIVFDGRGDPVSLVPMHPDRVKVEVLPNGRPRFRHRLDNGDEQVLVFEEVLWLLGLSADGYQPISPIEAEARHIGEAIATRDYGAAYFRNNAKPPAWIEHPGKFADADARRNFVAQFQAAYGGVNSGKTPVLEAGLKLHELGIKNTDAQYLESRRYQDVDIAGIFRVPPHKIGILDRATWGNIEHQALEFVTDTMLPWCRRWEQALQRDVFLDDDTFYCEFLLDVLLRGDIKSRYEAYGKGIQDGWITRNEVRERENLNRLDGLDEPLVPLNMAPSGSRGVDRARGDLPAAQGAAEAPDARAGLLLARAQAIVQTSAERVARKEWQLLHKAAGDRDPFDGHAEWVAMVMACEADTARAIVAQLQAEPLPRADADTFVSLRSAQILRQVDASPEALGSSAPATRHLAVEDDMGSRVNVSIHLPQGLVQLPAELSIPQPTINVAAPTVHVAPTPVHVDVQPAASPEVHVAAPVVNVAAPFVAVENRVPEVQEMRIVGMPERVREAEVSRDRDGNVKSSRQVERDRTGR